MRRWCDTCKDIIQEGPEPHTHSKEKPVPIIQRPIQRCLIEAEMELSHTSRWAYWKPVIKAAMDEYEKLKLAFDEQTRELNIACGVMTPKQLTEFRHRAYPTLYPR